MEGSILFDDVQVEEGAIVTNPILGPGAVVGRNCIVRGLSVLGAGSTIEEGNALDQGIRINPRVCLPSGTVSF